MYISKEYFPSQENTTLMVGNFKSARANKNAITAIDK